MTDATKILLGILIGAPLGLILSFVLFHLWLAPLADRFFDWIDERRNRR